MYSSVDVAWEMIQVAKRKGVALSQLQLQKLVYVAHGYLLGFKNKPLIRDEVEAWAYGPKIIQIYRAFKEYGDAKIRFKADTEIKTELDGDLDAIGVIDRVLEMYGDLDAVKLVTLTCQPNTPWDEVWNKQGGNRYNSCPISNDLIKNHFRKAIADQESVCGL